MHRNRRIGRPRDGQRAHPIFVFSDLRGEQQSSLNPLFSLVDHALHRCKSRNRPLRTDARGRPLQLRNFLRRFVRGSRHVRDEYGENLGVWDAYGYRGKIIALLRGVCTHRAPLHAASKLVRGSMKLLPVRFEIVTATVDGTLGGIGVGNVLVKRCRGFFPHFNPARATLADSLNPWISS
jgi:hypothetical protein